METPPLSIEIIDARVHTLAVRAITAFQRTGAAGGAQYTDAGPDFTTADPHDFTSPAAEIQQALTEHETHLDRFRQIGARCSISTEMESRGPHLQNAINAVAAYSEAAVEAEMATQIPGAEAEPQATTDARAKVVLALQTVDL